jgi:hypothetical protein
MKTERSSTSQKIEQMRNELEKSSQCEKYHKQDWQNNQELMNQSCEKAHPNQHQQAKRQRVDYTSIYSQEQHHSR